MLSTIPLIGVVFSWIGHTIGWTLSQPPELVISTLRSTCNLIIGGCQ